MKVNRILFYILNALNLGFLIYSIVVNNMGFVSISLFIIYSFLGLLNILIKEIKKFEYKRHKYQEPYYIFLIIIGTAFLYVVYRFNINVDFIIMFIISLLLFVLTGVIFYLLERFKKDKNKDKNGPKFVANR